MTSSQRGPASPVSALKRCTPLPVCFLSAPKRQEIYQGFFIRGIRIYERCGQPVGCPHLFLRVRLLRRICSGLTGNWTICLGLDHLCRSVPKGRKTGFCHHPVDLRRRQHPILHAKDQVRGIRHLRVMGHHDDAAALLVGQAAEDLHDDLCVFPV